MLYAIIDDNNKMLAVWHQINHFTTSSWAKRLPRNGLRIVAFEPKILAEYPITKEGIEHIKNFNNSLPGKKGKISHRDKPDDIVQGII